MKLGVLISGRGSNLQSLIDSCAEKDFPAEISVVISNKGDVYGLERAQKDNIPAITLSHKDYRSKQEFEAAIDKTLQDHDVDLICLAGFMRILSPWIIEKWPNKIINIHPSLLPKYKGLDTHQRAIDAGEKEGGCTIHYVVPEMDAGPIIVQKSVPIEKDDTADDLAQRVLKIEHQLYPDAIRILAKK